MATKKRTKPGRPSKLTDKVTRAAEEALALGVTVEDACASAGISPRTFRRWRRSAREGNERFIEFFDRMEMARAVARVESLKTIRSGKMINGEKDWKAEAWCAERAHPELSKAVVSRKVIDQAVMDRLEEMEDHMSSAAIAEMYDAYAKVYGLDAA